MKRLLNALLCFSLLAFVSSQAAIIEITPANARMINMIGKAPVGGGPDAWYSTTASTDTCGWVEAGTNSSAEVVIASGGTATTLRVYVGALGGTPRSGILCLYNASDELVDTCVLTVDATGYEECAINVAVSAATYRVSLTVDTDTNWQVSGNCAGTMSQNNSSVSGTCDDPVTYPGYGQADLYNLGVYVD